MKATLHQIGEWIARLARFSNHVVFCLFPFASLLLVWSKRLEDAVMVLAFWAVVVTGRMTIRKPRGNP